MKNLKNLRTNLRRERGVLIKMRNFVGQFRMFRFKSDIKTRFKCVLAAALFALAGGVGVRAAERADAAPDSVVAEAAPSRTGWIKQLMANGFDLQDTTVTYPAFPRFVVNAYRWAYDTFNGYDPEYVEVSPKNWMLQANSYSWMETQTMVFPERTALSMHSDFFSDAGLNLSYLIFSGGYQWNVNRWADSPAARKTYRTSLTCSRFSLGLRILNAHGGMRLTRFGNYNGGRRISLPFHDVDLASTNVHGYYFFNHRRYSHAAAYDFTRYQLRSAGTWLAGFDFSEQRLSMDFSRLPLEVLMYLPLREIGYRQHYRDYAALGGYAQNWVIRPRRWLINGMGMVSAGYKHRVGGGMPMYDEPRSLLANSVTLSVASVYNHRALYAGLSASTEGCFVFNSNFTHFSTVSALTATLGVRF